jgi:hypothetical protein
MIGRSSRFREWVSMDADNTITLKRTANGALISSARRTMMIYAGR